jgi:alkylation response protein AidB-like acyl-CoA dehydrogenase
MNTIASQLKTTGKKSPPPASDIVPLDTLREEEKTFQTSVTAFAQEWVVPRIRRCDEGARLDPELITAMFSQGLMGVEIPQSFGGQEASFFKAILAIETLSRFDPSVAVFFHVHNLLVNNLLLKFANPEQKQQYLPQLASGKVGAFAVTEPHVGSDLGKITSEAVSKGDHFIINGHKRWITNAAEADIFIVLARTPNDHTRRTLSTFLVDAHTPGVTIGERIAKLGVRASSTCEIRFENVVVPTEAVLGRPGGGIDVISHGITLGRIGIAAQMTGLTQGALDRAIAYASDREQFGAAIGKNQGVSFPLAHCSTEWHAARLFTYNVARKVEAGVRSFRLVDDASRAKLFASCVAERASSVALETLGGNGYAQAFMVEKFFRDAKVGKIYEGTSNILLRTLAHSLLPGVNRTTRTATSAREN